MTAARSRNWEQIQQDLANLDLITDPAQIAKLSLDYYHFSPILQSQLADKRGEIVVRPTTEAEVLQIARVCVKYRLPLTIRGAGTGNYGQCIPLEGGIILDTTRMNQIHWIENGVACVEPGVKMAAFDKQARPQGWELRMYPSTYRTATIGGFIGGGSGGIGSITYGQLRDPGNVLAAKVVTLEDEPRILELRSDAVQQVTHAYGTNGIIIQLEIALAPVQPWTEQIAVFDDFLSAARFGQALSDADGISKKLVSVQAAPIPSYFTALQDYLPSGKSCALVMVSQSSVEALQDLVKEYNGEITYHKNSAEAQKGLILAEYTWNHTTLHARAVDANLTYLQTFYFTLEKVEQMYQHFGDEVTIHLEFLRGGGRAIPAGLQLVKFSTAERLQEIIDYHESQDIAIANPHTYILEDGGRKTVDIAQLNFKKAVDPYGLMNPGKMRAWWEET
ncbi:MAG: FAD-binding oxidoreductase [Jaaginema sp. PMC 1079.18]|nr:FAD-binding oxidoreductase [Jaaginema sp. PMC 1080.18]MEC4850553.1 FAD-binding oxidoreductase [Jaaginema sp. PMC 1079.18]MEC4865475.1 FAD-binding oxidoreductase [Jaaginema sp. PMC 1078.18]